MEEDYLLLTGKEKKQIVRNQLKNLQYSKFIAQLNYDVENRNPDKFTELLNSLGAELDKINSKEQYLIEVLNELNEQYPDSAEVV